MIQLGSPIYLLVVVVVQSASRPTLCNPMDHSTPGFPVPHHFLESTQVPVHCVSDAIHFSSSGALFFCPTVFPSISFPMSWLFASGDQNTGASVPLVQRRTNNLNVWSHQDHNKGDISSPKGKVGCYYQKKKKDANKQDI